MSPYPSSVLPQPSLHGHHFTNSVLGTHLNNSTSSSTSSGILNGRSSTSTTPPGSTPMTRPFPIFVPGSNHASTDISPHSPPTSSGGNYMSLTSNQSPRGKRSSTPNSENSVGSDSETPGSCRCGIINCVAGNEHRVSSLYVNDPPSPVGKVEGLAGVYTPTATSATPSGTPSIILPINNTSNNSNNNNNENS